MVTYIPYVLIEFVSNFALKKVGPRIMLPSLCVLWGLVATCQSTIQNYAGLLICRFCLGLTEGGMFPAFVLYLSEFYKRSELQKRIGVIYGAASISGAFSGLLAAAISKMNGVRRLAGWRWIFLLEGVVTIVFGLFAASILPNTPDKAIVLNTEEKAYSTQRLAAEIKVKENPHISTKAIISTFAEPHVLIMGVIGFCNGIVISGIAYFTPSIVQAMGYGQIRTQLMTVPPYACAFVVTMIAAFMADKYGQRGLTALSTLSLAVMGCAINLTCKSVGARYTAQCLLVTSIYSTAPSLLTWQPNNTATYARRATAVAIIFVTSNVAGMVAMWLYPTSTAPRYLFATKFNLVTIIIGIVCIVAQILLLRHLNKGKVQNRDVLLQEVAHLPLDEQMEVLGDHHPDFKYVL